MIKADISNAELGNLIFGNSHGEYKVEPRMEYQDVFCEFLQRNGWNYHAIRGDGYECEYSFENDIFIIRAYYWGVDDAIADLPNFVYKPTGLEIRWYKYPMRDAYSNMDVDIETFKGILEKCEESMK